jgi:4-azaleucine resistance transporter AzlC
MSLVVFAGAMQFVAIGILLAPIGLIQVALLTLFVNIRHLFYGLSLIKQFKTFGWKKHYIAFALTDETYSLLCSKKVAQSENPENLFFIIALLNHAYWLIGTALGVTLGRLITFDTTGIEFAMTALFLVIFIEQWQTYRTHYPALLGIAATILMAVVFGPNQLVLPSMLVILSGLFLYKKQILQKEGDQHD